MATSNGSDETSKILNTRIDEGKRLQEEEERKKNSGRLERKKSRATPKSKTFLTSINFMLKNLQASHLSKVQDKEVIYADSQSWQTEPDKPQIWE